MKKKNIIIIPCVIVLLLFVASNFYSLLSDYEEMVNATGLIDTSIETEVKEENERARESEIEYRNLLESSIDIGPEGGLVEQNDPSGITNAENPQAGGELDENGRQNNTPSSEEKLNLHAISALLLDADNNRVLYEKNGYNRMPMASTTKIMTCIVALENASPNSIVTVSSYAASMPDVQLKIRTGDQYYLKDLLYSLMLESHNDSAVAIAECVGGSIEGFATMMNDKARDLGCMDTNFITPNGLDADGHYTSARDLAIIASYAIKNKDFLTITNTSAYQFKEIKSGRSYTVKNKNRFLYMMDGAIGVKTGFTGDAGYCFVGAIKREDKTLISVVLGCGWPPNKNLKWRDTKELMNYGVDNYKERQIFEDIEFDPVLVSDGQQRFVHLDMQGSLTLLMRDNETVKIVYNVPSKLQAPVKAHTVIGNASYYISDLLYAKIPIYTTEEIAKIDFSFCIQKIFKLWSLQ